MSAADQAEVRDAGLDDDFLDVLHPAVEEVRERHFRNAYAERGMEIGASQVSVHEKHFFPKAGKRDSDVAGD